MDCIDEAHQLFEAEYLNNLRQVKLIAEELEPTVYCTLAKYVDDMPALDSSGSILMHVVRLLKNREENLDKIYKLIAGGGCSRNETNIDLILDASIMTYELTLLKLELTADDRKHMLVSLINGSYESTLRAIKFITKNYLTIDKLYQSSTQRWTDVFNALGQHTVTAELLDLYDQFIKTYDEFGTFKPDVRELAITNYNKSVKNVEWSKTYLPQIEDWLIKNVNDGGNGASMEHLSFIILTFAGALVLRNIWL